MFRFKNHGAGAPGRETSPSDTQPRAGVPLAGTRSRPGASELDELNARLNLYPLPRNVVRMPQVDRDLLERARAFRGKRG